MSWLNPKRNQSGKGFPQALDTTVTYLEMSEHLVSHIQRPVNVNAALLTTENIPLHFYRYLYFQVGIHWNWEMRLRLSDVALAKAIHSPDVEITVLYVDGTPAGFYEINRANHTATDLAYFGIMPHVHGRGLGKWFLSTAIDACWTNDPERITVNTCTLDHPAALPLYQKMGFKPTRQAKGSVKPLSDNEKAALAQKNGLFSA
ncbi:MAG: GNAT family N-acetyltransferase [Pseudomonadota bacterium]